MSIMSLVIFLLVGLASGWIAGNIMKGRGFGIVGNMVVGAVVLLFAISFIKKKA